MDWHEFPIVAGTVSTLLFVVSYLPMLVKAFRTRDLESYSLGNLLIANVGNGVHSIYVFSLPPVRRSEGPRGQGRGGPRL